MSMRAPNTVTVLACGLAGVGVGYGSQSLIEVSAEATAANVAKCAPYLGEKLVKRSTLPEGCQYFESSFGYTETEVTKYTPTDKGSRQDDVHVSTTKIYDLPDKASFTREQALASANMERLKDSTAAMMGGVGLIFGFGIVVLSRPRKGDQEDKADS